jgi:hypothetical protein
MLNNKKKLTAEEKATLRHGVSRIIDLSAHIHIWFTETERQDMMKGNEEIQNRQKILISSLQRWKK